MVKEGRGRGRSLFFILGVSALEGFGGVIKSHASGSRDVQSVIVSLSALNESSFWPFLKWQDHKNPPLPLARNVPTHPQKYTLPEAAAADRVTVAVYACMYRGEASAGLS